MGNEVTETQAAPVNPVNTAAQNTTEQPTPAFSNEAQFMALFSKNTPAGRELRKQIVESNVNKTPPNTSTPNPAQPPAQAQPATPPQTNATPPQTQAPATDEVEKIDLGIGTLELSRKPATPVEPPKTFEEAYSRIKDDIGFEIKNPQDLIEKAPVIKNWRADSQKLGEVSEKYNATIENLENLSDDAKFVLQSELNGEDWRSNIGNKKNLDTSKPFEKQDIKKVVEFFYGDKLSPEELETVGTDQASERVREFQDLSKDKYTAAKTIRDTAVNTRLANASAFREKYSASVKDSMSGIKDQLPFFTDQGKLAQIEKELADYKSLGNNPGASEFFNKDGTLTKDAAVKLTLQKHGLTIISALVKRVSDKVESQTNESIVRTGNQSPSQSGGHNGSGIQVSQETLNQLNFLKNMGGGNGGSPYGK